MSFVILIRGHERNTFQTNRLSLFINRLGIELNINLNVHIHTWEKTEAKSSWRELNTIPRNITKSDIDNYFDIDVTSTIDNEEEIRLHGNTYGKIGAIPIVCWKRMWYGQYSGIKTILSKYNNPNTIILNMRMDFFSCNTTKKYDISESDIIQMCKECIENPNKIIFSHESGEYDGIDNIFVGNSNNMYNLIKHFHFNLDDISSKYNYLMFHESMVYYESEVLSGNIVEMNPITYYSKILSNQIISSLESSIRGNFNT